MFSFYPIVLIASLLRFLLFGSIYKILTWLRQKIQKHRKAQVKIIKTNHNATLKNRQLWFCCSPSNSFAIKVKSSLHILCHSLVFHFKRVSECFPCGKLSSSTTILLAEKYSFMWLTQHSNTHLGVFAYNQFPKVELLGQQVCPLQMCLAENEQITLQKG